MRRFLFQVHLWTGLILGLVFVAVGASGSIAMFWPVFQAPPAVQVTAAEIPALDKALAAARTAAGAPADAGATLMLPDSAAKPIRIHFGAPRGSGRELPLPDVAADPATGRTLAIYRPQAPAWFRAIEGFHSHLSIPGGRFYEGWLGLIMVFLGLSGLYLWWPKAGQWKNAFVVRRTAKGLRFHRELHGAVGIWTLAIYLVVCVTGVAICFPMANRTVITFLSGGGPVTPRHAEHAPVIAPMPGAVRIGPDAALARAQAVSSERIVQIQMPANEDEPIRAVPGLPGNVPVYLNPYNGAIVANPNPPPTTVDRAQRMMGRLHEAIGLGFAYEVLVFLSGMVPLIFFITGCIMWSKKRQNRLAMNRPLPDDA